MLRYASALIISTLVWIAPASSYYFGYSKWLALSYPARVAYIAGAYDTLTGYAKSGGNRYGPSAVCINNAGMSIGQLAENVQNFAKDKPQYQTGMVQDAIFGYLVEACGPAE
jgi:hypothetical protein